MTVTIEEGVKAQGNISVRIIQTIANPLTPKLTEASATTSGEVMCHVYGNQQIATKTQTKGERPRRGCTSKVRQRFGNTTYEFSDLQYAHNPQLPLTAAVNRVKQLLVPGTVVWAMVRYGLPVQERAYAVGDIVDLWRIELGVQNKTMTGEGEFDELSITQGGVVIADPIEDVALVA